MDELNSSTFDKTNDMRKYYQRIILNDRTETYIIEADGKVKLIVESADVQGGVELGYFKISETTLTETAVKALSGIHQLSNTVGAAYVQNVNDWINNIPGSRPPIIPRP